MDSHQEVFLTPMANDDRPHAFEIYKSELHQLVEEAFGWNEEFEKKHFQRGYKPEWFYWIEADSQQIGYLCYHEGRHELNVSFIIIRKKFQDSHYGARAMEKIRTEAEKKNKPVTLSVLVNNKKAQEFYKKLGYEILRRDSDFYEMILKVNRSPTTSPSDGSWPKSESL